MFTNCVLWNNGGNNSFGGTSNPATVRYSLFGPSLSYYTTDSTNLTTTVSPFVSATDFSLNACAPAIDAGINTAYSAVSGPSTDVAGNPRIFGPAIDMGALEFQGASSRTVLTTQPAAASTVCVGTSVSVAVVAPGTGTLTYQWYKDGQVLSPAQSTPALTLDNVQTTDAGSYSVVVTGSCNSVTSTAFSLTVATPPGLTPTASGPLTCAQTSVTLTASASATTGELLTYTFSGPGITSQNAAVGTAVVNASGTYSVTVTTASGCLSTTSIQVLSNTAMAPLSLTPNSATLTCSSPAVSLSALGTGSVLWSTGAVTPVISVTTAGPYSVTLTNQNGCRSVASLTVVQNATPPTATLTNNGPLSCSLTSVTLTASGGGSYRFSSGATQVNNGPTATVSTAGVYSVTVVGSNGCSAIASTTVAGDQSVPTATLTNNGPISCSTTSVTLTAGGGSSYRFSSGVNQIGNGPTATVGQVGVYSVTVISANGCSATISTTVTGDQRVPTASLTNNGSISCSMTSVTLTASGGSTYQFSNGASQVSNGCSATVSTAGVYSVTVVSSNGCSATASTTVMADVGLPVVSIQANPSLTISQGQSTILTAAVSGTQPFAFAWSTMQTTPTISVSTAGPYSVTVVGSNGCFATAIVVVNVTATPVVSGPFAITGVNLVSCTPINEFRKVISITPVTADWMVHR